VIHDGMPCDQIQGHGGPKVAKMTNFIVLSSPLHVIKRLMVNVQIFLYFSSFGITWPL